MSAWDSLVAATESALISQIGTHPAVLAITTGPRETRVAFLREHVRRAGSAKLNTRADLAVFTVVTRVLQDGELAWSDDEVEMLLDHSASFPAHAWVAAIHRALRARPPGPLWGEVWDLLSSGPPGWTGPEGPALRALLASGRPFGDEAWAVQYRAELATWPAEARAAWRDVVSASAPSLRRPEVWCEAHEASLAAVGAARLDALAREVLPRVATEGELPSAAVLEEAELLDRIVAVASTRLAAEGVARAVATCATQALAPVREGGCARPSLGYRALAALSRSSEGRAEIARVMEAVPSFVRARWAKIG